MINIDKPHGEVVLILKCYERVISQTGIGCNANKSLILNESYEN